MRETVRVAPTNAQGPNTGELVITKKKRVERCFHWPAAFGRLGARRCSAASASIVKLCNLFRRQMNCGKVLEENGGIESGLFFEIAKLEE